MERVAVVAEAVGSLAVGGRRVIVAVAGAPASGKSTLADQLVDRLAPRAAGLGMDAFHYDDAILEARGHRDRKGAPHTFDVDNYRRMLTVLRNEPGVDIGVPVFDRELELTRNSASIVTADHDIVITEGNYLLLDEPPWSDLAALFDLTVWVNASVELLRERLIDRWRSYGFTDAEATARTEHNDLPNASTVVERSRAADMVIDAR